MMYGGKQTLEDYLAKNVFSGVHSTTLAPERADVAGFRAYRKRYEALLAVERKAIEAL